jgi:hypothetical protein
VTALRHDTVTIRIDEAFGWVSLGGEGRMRRRTTIAVRGAASPDMTEAFDFQPSTSRRQDSK